MPPPELRRHADKVGMLRVKAMQGSSRGQGNLTIHQAIGIFSAAIW